MLKYQARHAASVQLVKDLFEVDFRSPPGTSAENEDRWRANMAEMLARRLPGRLSADTIMAFLTDLRQRLSETSEARTWPTEKAVITAIDHLERRHGATHHDDLQPETYQWFVKWVRVHKKAPPSKLFDDRCMTEMVRRNMITLAELKATQVALPDSLRGKKPKALVEDIPFE